MFVWKDRKINEKVVGDGQFKKRKTFGPAYFMKNLALHKIFLIASKHDQIILYRKLSNPDKTFCAGISVTKCSNKK